MQIQTAFRSFEARRFQDQFVGQLKIQQDVQLTDLIPLGTEGFTVKFTTSISYGPLGIIRMEGDAQVPKAEDKDEILAQWTKERKMNPKSHALIIQGVLQASLTQAVILSRDIRLPPPIPFPQVTAGPAKGAPGRTSVDLI